MGKKFISSEDAVQAKCQHTTPCSDCPWRRDSLNGWLGGAVSVFGVIFLWGHFHAR